MEIDPAKMDHVYRFAGGPNPLEVSIFNSSILTALSTKWAKYYLLLEDVYAFGPRERDFLVSGRMHEIAAISVVMEQEDKTSDFAGVHRISPVICHTPLPCDYPHLDILIRHQFTMNGVVYDETIQYEQWPGSMLEKKRKNSFIKQLKKSYQVELANQFLDHVKDEADHQYKRAT